MHWAVLHGKVDALRVLLKVNDSIIFAEGMLFASTIYTHGYAGDMAEGYKWCLRAIYSDKFFWDENIEQRRTHAAEIAKELWSETKIRCHQGLDIEYSELVALNIEQMRRDIRGLTDPPVAKQLVDESLESLSETRNKVLRLYFGLDKETMTLQEIADSHNLTLERVRHIKDMAIKDLRNRTRSPIKKLHYLHQEVIQDIINRHLFNIR